MLVYLITFFEANALAYLAAASVTKNASFMTSTPVEPRAEAGWPRGSHLQTKVLVVERRFFAGKNNNVGKQRSNSG